MGKLPGEYEKGRGAQHNPQNRFEQLSYVKQYIEGIDDWVEETPKTSVTEVYPKTIVNKVKANDIPFMYSANPYQGCEHGCVYCYARLSHQFWGYSSGSDFERKILVKKNAPELLELFFRKRNYVPQTIVLSGNTDCYQPIEKQYKITREMLKLFLKYKHPVSIITKNSLILRDIDVISELAKYRLITVNISLTTLNESLRRVLEPRTATSAKKIECIKQLAAIDVPVNIMVAPIIPSINDNEIFNIAKITSEAGATGIGHTLVRLNGEIAEIFKLWVEKNFPDRSEKVLNQIKSMHGGVLGDMKYNKRLKGEGKYADNLRQMFVVAKQRYFRLEKEKQSLRIDLFKRHNPDQYSLFE